MSITTCHKYCGICHIVWLDTQPPMPYYFPMSEFTFDIWDMGMSDADLDAIMGDEADDFIGGEDSYLDSYWESLYEGE